MTNCEIVKSKIMPGSYPAKASGYVTQFDAYYVDTPTNRESFSAHFQNGVRGFNVPDVITIDSDGNIESKILGKNLISLYLHTVIKINNKKNNRIKDFRKNSNFCISTINNKENSE